MRISDWSSDVCSSDLLAAHLVEPAELFGASIGAEAGGEQLPECGVGVVPSHPRQFFHDPGQAGDVGIAAPFGPPRIGPVEDQVRDALRSEEHTSELQSLMRNSYAVFCLQKKHTQHT